MSRLPFKELLKVIFLERKKLRPVVTLFSFGSDRYVTGSKVIILYVLSLLRFLSYSRLLVSHRRSHFPIKLRRESVVSVHLSKVSTKLISLITFVINLPYLQAEKVRTHNTKRITIESR